MKTGMARLLEQGDYGKTRKLWEEIFTEDGQEFLDYYYKYCTEENRIYGIEREDGTLASMAQFNPHEVWLGGTLIQSDYIVAVATDPCCRHQGLMSRILKKGMDECYNRREPFVFLMPASEAIYRPFDFCTVYGKNQMWVERSKALKNSGIVAGPVEKNKLGELVRLSNRLLQERYDVYTRRTPAYFERMEAELACENGKVIGFFREQALVGYCFTAEEDDIQVWELLTEEGVWESLFDALFLYFDREKGQGRVMRLKASAFPRSLERGEVSRGTLIMVRIVNLEALLSCLRSRREAEFTIRVEDGILTQNRGVYRVMLNQECARVFRLPLETPEDCLDGIFTMAELTEELFGENAGRKAPGLGVQAFERIYLNEMV